MDGWNTVGKVEFSLRKSSWCTLLLGKRLLKNLHIEYTLKVKPAIFAMTIGKVKYEGGFTAESRV